MKICTHKRRTQIFLVSILLAFSSTTNIAIAQTASPGVTLYGLVSVGVGFIKGNDRSKVGFMEGYGRSPRWGLRMSEDLGSGLKAGAVLESGFRMSTGVSSQGGRLFGRQAYLSLSSEQYGEIRMGRQVALHSVTSAYMNSTASATVIGPTYPYTTSSGLLFHVVEAPRLDNTLQLISPRFYGLQTQFMYGFTGENNEDLYRGIRLHYLDGPIDVSATFESSSVRNPAVQINGKSSANKLIAFGGSCDFAVMKLFAGYQQIKDMAAASAGRGSRIGPFTLAQPGGFIIKEFRAFTAGASIPVDAFTYATTFTRTRYRNAVGQSLDISRYGVAVMYRLSRRTEAYTALAFTGGDLKSVIYEKRLGELGLRHRF